jgi:hypothetical protein
MKTIEDVRCLAKHIIGVDNYYREVENIKSDICFFNEYIKRMKKSLLLYEIKPTDKVAYELFSVYYDLEDAYSSYVVLKYLITKIWEVPDSFEENIEYFDFFKSDGIDIENLVEYIVPCGSLVSFVKGKIKGAR